MLTRLVNDSGGKLDTQNRVHDTIGVAAHGM
jgi:hypothetical protein